MVKGRKDKRNAAAMSQDTVTSVQLTLDLRVIGGLIDTALENHTLEPPLDILSTAIAQAWPDDDRKFGHVGFRKIAKMVFDTDSRIFAHTRFFDPSHVSQWLNDDDCEVQQYDNDSINFDITILNSLFVEKPTTESIPPAETNFSWASKASAGVTPGEDWNVSGKAHKKPRLATDMMEEDDDHGHRPSPIKTSYSWDKTNEFAEESAGASKEDAAEDMSSLDHLIDAITDKKSEEKVIFSVPQYFKDKLPSLAKTLETVKTKFGFNYEYKDVRNFKFSHPDLFGEDVSKRDAALVPLKTLESLKKSLKAFKLIATLFKGLQTIYSDSSRDYNLARKYISHFVGLHYQTICLGRSGASIKKFIVGTESLRDNLIIAMDHANPQGTNTGTCVIEIWESAMRAIIRTFARGGANENEQEPLSEVIKFFVKSVAGVAMETLPKYMKAVPNHDGKKRLRKARAQNKRIDLPAKFIDLVEVTKKPKLERRAFLTPEENTFVAKMNSQLQNIESGVAKSVTASADALAVSKKLKVLIDNVFSKVKAVNSFLMDRKQSVFRVMKCNRIKDLAAMPAKSDEYNELYDQRFSKTDWNIAFGAYRESSAFTSLIELCIGDGRLTIASSNQHLNLW